MDDSGITFTTPSHSETSLGAAENAENKYESTEQTVAPDVKEPVIFKTEETEPSDLSEEDAENSEQPSVGGDENLNDKLASGVTMVMEGKSDSSGIENCAAAGDDAATVDSDCTNISSGATVSDNAGLLSGEQHTNVNSEKESGLHEVPPVESDNADTSVACSDVTDVHTNSEILSELQEAPSVGGKSEQSESDNAGGISSCLEVDAEENFVQEDPVCKTEESPKQD